jgi:hypothetical protein
MESNEREREEKEEREREGEREKRRRRGRKKGKEEINSKSLPLPFSSLYLSLSSIYPPFYFSLSLSHSLTPSPLIFYPSSLPIHLSISLSLSPISLIWSCNFLLGYGKAISYVLCTIHVQLYMYYLCTIHDVILIWV